MTWNKLLFYIGIAVSILTAWAGPDVGVFSPKVVEVFGFAVAALTAFASSVEDGINGPSHKVALLSVVLAVLGVLVSFAGFVGPDVARFAALAITTIAAATGVGHPAKPNPDTSKAFRD